MTGRPRPHTREAPLREPLARAPVRDGDCPKCKEAAPRGLLRTCKRWGWACAGTGLLLLAVQRPGGFTVRCIERQLQLWCAPHSAWLFSGNRDVVLAIQGPPSASDDHHPTARDARDGRRARRAMPRPRGPSAAQVAGRAAAPRSLRAQHPAAAAPGRRAAVAAAGAVGDPARCRHQGRQAGGGARLRLHQWHAGEGAAAGAAAAAGCALAAARPSAPAPAPALPWCARARRHPPPPRRAGFPPGPSGDQALTLVGDPLGFITAAQQQHGDVVGLLLGGERVVLVADPQAARQVGAAAAAARAIRSLAPARGRPRREGAAGGAAPAARRRSRRHGTGRPGKPPPPPPPARPPARAGADRAGGRVHKAGHGLLPRQRAGGQRAAGERRAGVAAAAAAEQPGLPARRGGQVRSARRRWGCCSAAGAAAAARSGAAAGSPRSSRAARAARRPCACACAARPAPPRPAGTRRR
jgi:hypothetical protein